MSRIHPFWFILVCTTCETVGDAMVRKSLYDHSGAARVGLILLGMILLLGYGVFLNLAPVEFGRVVGLYIATLFIMWQIINYISFGALPSLPVVVGGSLIVAGGLIVTFWTNR